MTGESKGLVQQLKDLIGTQTVLLAQATNLIKKIGDKNGHVIADSMLNRHGTRERKLQYNGKSD